MAAKSRKYLANRAGRLRRKQEAGKKLSPKEQAEVDEWEAIKTPGMGMPRKSEIAKKAKVVKTDAKPTDPIKASQPTSSSLDQTPRAAPRAKTAPTETKDSLAETVLAPPPKPPPILKADGKVGDWRQKYGGTQISREQACTMSANLWKNLLVKLNAQIEKMEGKPFVSNELLDNEIYPAMVLTVDKVLPTDFEVTPEIIAAAGTTVVCIQRVVVGLKHAEKQKKQKGKKPKPAMVSAKEETAAVVSKSNDTPETPDEPRKEIDNSYEMQPKDVF